MSLEEERRKEPDDDEDLEGSDEDPEEVEANLALATEDEVDEGDEASLEALLSQRAAARRATDESEDDDIMALASEKVRRSPAEVRTSRVIPIKTRQEFVCNRCHLVKARSQLSDEVGILCRDCV